MRYSVLRFLFLYSFLIINLLGMSPAHAVHEKIKAMFCSQLWFGAFPKVLLTDDFGEGNPKAVIEIKTVTGHFATQVTKVRNTETGDEKVTRTISTIAHPDPIGTQTPFITVTPCFLGCCRAPLERPNEVTQNVTVEVTQVVKNSCKRCRHPSLHKHETTPGVFAHNLKKEPFADYSVTRNLKPEVPECQVQRKELASGFRIKNVVIYPALCPLNVSGLVHVINHTCPMRVIETSVATYADEKLTDEQSTAVASEEDVETIKQGLQNSEEYQALVSDPDMPGCSKESQTNEGRACYQDELMGTDCSTAIYQVRVTQGTGRQVAGVLVVPHHGTDAILMFDHPEAVEQGMKATTAGAGMGIDGRESPAGHDIDDWYSLNHRDSMRRARRNRVLSEEEKMRIFQQHSGGRKTNSFSAMGGKEGGGL